MIEKIAHGTIRTEITAEFRKCMPHLGNRSIPVIGQTVDHDRRSARTIPFITNLLVLVTTGVARATLNRTFNVVFGHTLRFGLVDG